MSYSYYMLLYTACYNYCISSNKSHEIPGYGPTPIGSSGTVKGESPPSAKFLLVEGFPFTTRQRGVAC